MFLKSFNCEITKVSNLQKREKKILFCFRTNIIFLFFQVKIWFQNRRTKWKKQDNISNAEAAEHKNQTTGKQTGKSNKCSADPKNISNEGAINLVKTESNNKVPSLGGTVKLKEINGDKDSAVVNLSSKQRNNNDQLKKCTIDIMKIPPSDNSIVHSLFKNVEATSPNSIEDHSNTSLFTPDGSASESCYSEAAEIRVPLVGLPLGLNDGNVKSLDISRSPLCDNNSQSQLSPSDHLVIAETEDFMNNSGS